MGLKNEPSFTQIAIDVACSAATSSGLPPPVGTKWIAGKPGVVSSTSKIAIGSGAEE